MDTRQTSRSTDSVEQRLSKLEETIAGMQVHNDEVALQLKTDMIREMKSLFSERPTPPTIDVDNPHFPDHGESSTHPPPAVGTTRMLKVEMTRFDGHDPKGWLFKTERHFTYYDLTDEERFTMVSVNMEGAALSWFQAMFENHQLTTWTRFRENLLHRFGPSPFHDLKGELMKLQQTGTVQEYYNQFEGLVNQIAGMNPEVLQSCFESGLRRDIARDVRVLQPKSLDHALHLAQIMEDRLADTSMTHFYSSSTSSTYHPISKPSSRPTSFYFPPSRPLHPKQTSSPPPSPQLQLPAPPILGHPPHPTSITPFSTSPNRPHETRPPSLPIRRLTPAQMDDRRAKGLCFNCNDQYTKGHRCAARLFLLVTSYEDDPEMGEPPLEEEEPP